jgi:H+/Cl- antiporter ClcA
MKTPFVFKILKAKLTERRFEEDLLFVSIGIVSAIICSGYAKLFSATEAFSLNLFSQNRGLLFAVAPVGLISSYLFVRWFSPFSNGSGIPQVMACIEPDHHHLARRMLRKSVIVMKMLSSLVAVFSGAAIGREGPSLQISASIAYNLSLLFEKFKIKLRPEQVLVAGAASGLAAAFNTPIGGIVYAIEELSKEHVRNFRDVLLLAVVISGLTAQLILGNYLYLGYPTVPKANGLFLLMAVALLSLVCGILGGLFSKLLMILIEWRSRKSFTQQLIIIGSVGIVLALFFFFLGGESLYSGKEVINEALFSKESFQWPLAITRFLTPLLSSMTGISGGIFAPSLSAGAAIGSLSAELLDPTMKAVLTLAGMVGFLTGVTHSPITSFILVLEMTDRHSVVFPMMIASVLSSLGARFISKHSFYEEALEKILDSNRK